MKELSIEEKAKRYDEALEIAKEINNEQQAQPFNVMTKVFPELKESEDEKVRKEIVTYLKSVIANKGYRDIIIESWIAWLEKQGVQKPVDKVEPKFKVGDWVTNSIETVQITGYDIDYGYQVDYKGNLQHRDTDIIEKEYHHWTIQDAKDGDVLSYRDGQWIFIYKKLVDGDTFCYHALYSTIHQDLTIDDAAFTLLGSAIIPATKKQRDILMKAMADAGYIFDFEKKELKKIEQNPAWSEEDETVLNNLIYALANDRIGNDRDEYISYLKSLKERYTWRPSDEQVNNK